jgi:AbrB family looped-hinge helix DNA binding protein
MMKSTVSKQWRITIPAVVRKQLKLNEGDSLVWLVDGSSVRVVALPPNPLRALRGTARGEGLHEALMEERRRERSR